MTSGKSWQPTIETEPELNPFANGASKREGLLDTPQLVDPDDDSSPLQGSHDLSDEDSLQDVIADRSGP